MSTTGTGPAPGEGTTLQVTPDRYTTVRYAGASGDFNPIHIDEDFARSVGLPGRILHGLWTMSQVARAHTEGFGGPGSLASLAVQFRGMGVPEQPVTITATVTSAADGELAVSSEAVQAGRRLVRNGRATIRRG